MKFLTSILFLFLIALTNQQYNDAIAFQLGEISACAYSSPQSIRNWNCQNCQKHSLKDITLFENIQYQILGFAGYSPNLNAIIVAFRGSKTIENWIQDIGFMKIYYPLCSGCKVHRGFFASYSSVSKTILRDVAKLKSQYPESKLVTTGHSLGGALAILCAAELMHTFGKVDYVYTFGQPRVGNKKFADWVQLNIPQIYRLDHYTDIVPHLPMRLQGFYHSGREIWYTKDMSSYKNCQRQQKQCANSLGMINMGPSSHPIKLYLKMKILSKLMSHDMGIFKGSHQTFIKNHLMLRYHY